MNNRVKELAIEAGLIATMNSDHEGLKDFDYRKFAELIIQGCLDQCYYRGMNDELYAGQLRAAEYIEEYFGVK